MTEDLHGSVYKGNKTNWTGLPTVSEFYSGKNVFITGGTGFIGKVLIEKLLRSCPRLNKLYLLMRQKKSKDIHQRLEDLADCQIFEKVREKQPSFKGKLIPIEGDICLPDLGISDADRLDLEENVNVVFHSAATIRFDEPIRVAVEMNLLGVRRMVNLCKRFKKLDVFVHVSTAYANCDRPFIEEVVYPTSMEPRKLIDLLDWMDDKVLDLITPYLIGNKPNTYTYTKHLAEELLIKEGSSMPLAIVRPSMVGASWKEPFPGWIDNFNGPSGFNVALGKGILRSMNCDPKAVADLIPVDIPVNMLATVAWYTAITKPDKILIYNCTIGSVNPCTWEELTLLCKRSTDITPFDSCFRIPKIHLTTNGLLHNLNVLIQHTIPAYLADMGLCLSGKKARMVRLYKRLHKTMDCLTYFSMNSWEWTYTNQDLLVSHMSPEDRKTFYLDLRSLHWPTYVEHYQLGTKKFLLKEDMANLPAARSHLRKLKYIRYAINCIVTLLLSWVPWWIVTMVMKYRKTRLKRHT